MDRVEESAQIEQLRRRIAELEETERQYRSIFNFSSDALLILDLIDRIVDANPSASELFGYSHAELTARSGADLLRAGGERVLDRLWRGTQDAKPLHVESFARRKDGDPLEVDVMGTRFDYAGEECVLVVVRDITERKRLEAELRRLAATDDLTGLFNRRRFIELGERELARATRYESPLSLILFDLDYFKRVNDTFGHLAGDQVLQAVAAECRDQLRESDILARLGGEEFGVLAVETGLAQSIAVAERLRGGHARLVVSTEAADISITSSFGVAQLRDSEDDIDLLIGRADAALNRAKDNGRDRVEVDP